MRNTRFSAHYLALAATGALLTAPAATAQTTQLGSAHIVEWDLPTEFDFNPGAIVVDTRGEDNNRVWFVTRIGAQKVYRFNVQPSLMKNGGPAQWTSWDFIPDATSGGIRKLRPSHDRRFIVVRTSESIQEIDTQKCAPGTPAQPTACDGALRLWQFADPEQTVLVSDVAVDDSRRVFTVGVGTAIGTDEGYIQMLIPTKATADGPAPFGTATQWPDPGVNQCISAGLGAFCNSGVDFQPSNQNLVYVSNQVQNTIDELNINTNVIRRWTLPPDENAQAITEPRMLKIDSNGTVWVITGSGHLVSLNPKNSSRCPAGMNRMTRHRIPPEIAFQSDGWGIAPDSNVIGYTDASNNKVGMLLPHDAGTCVKPVVSDPVTPIDRPATVKTLPTTVISDVVNGDPKTTLKQTTAKNDGTYVEAVIDMPAPNSDPSLTPPNSLSPLGITPVKSKAQGTYFYAVGFAAGTDPTGAPAVAKRIGFVRLGVPERINNPRDDEDSDDGMDTTTHPTWHESAVGDFDADGVPDQFDTTSNKENMTGLDVAAVSPTAPASFTATTTSTSLALIASAAADNPTAVIAVDVYNAAGALVGTSGPMAGIAATTLALPGAGTFTVKVRNLGLTSVNITPTLVVREPLLP
jgi:hypothetical protein